MGITRANRSEMPHCAHFGGVKGPSLLSLSCFSQEYSHTSLFESSSYFEMKFSS